MKLATPDFPCLGSVHFDAETAENRADPLVACLRGRAPAEIAETTVALGATVLALLATLIGERLTWQVLRESWPAFDASAPNEETK